jgi:uncharacterized membrane protein YkvA (DUF1232 family)
MGFMVFFGGLLALLGLATWLFRDADVLGLPPVAVAVTLLVLGGASIAVGIVHRNARRKRRIAAGEPEPVGSIIDRARALPRLLRAGKQGYDGLPKRRLALWGFALLYLVSPIDILPEVLPIIGVTDDAGVAVWLLTSVSAASGLYLRWERERAGSPPRT